MFAQLPRQFGGAFSMSLVIIATALVIIATAEELQRTKPEPGLGTKTHNMPS